MNNELVARLAKAIRASDDACGGERHGQYWNDLARACLTEIEAAGYAVVPGASRLAGL